VLESWNVNIGPKRSYIRSEPVNKSRILSCDTLILGVFCLVVLMEAVFLLYRYFYGRQRVIRRILRSRAASPSDGVYHATSSVRRAAFPCCDIVFSRCQPTSSPRTSFPQQRRQRQQDAFSWRRPQWWQDAFSERWLTSSAPQRPTYTRSSRVELHRASRRHLGRRQNHITSRSLPSRRR
jgi:hypothetical protein